MRDGTKTRTKTACVHLFPCFSRVNNVASDGPIQSALPASPACLLSVRLSVLSTLSRLSIYTVSTHTHSHSLSKQCAVTTHRNTAQRIASHCIESLLVTVQCFFSLPLLLSFVASVPGPVPVLILLFCLRHHQHHDHQHRHINRSLVSPTTAAIHDPHTASSGSHVTEIA